MLQIKDKTTYGEQYADVVNYKGNLDFVRNGDILRNADMQVVMVSSQSELSMLGDYETGTIAVTAGFINMWQKAPDGTWVSFE